MRIPTSSFLLLLITLTILSACKQSYESDKSLIKVELEPAAPDENGGLRWSPKGEKLQLRETTDGLVTELALGPESAKPINLMLFASDPGGKYDRLALDMDRDGDFNGDKDTVYSCVPTERRGKTWSSFSGVISVPFPKMKRVKACSNPYPIAFWYVFDPLAEDSEMALRYSRRGWMEGLADSEFGPIRVLLTEMTMDGVFNSEDRWAIAPDSIRKSLFQSKSAKGIDTHNWFGEQAFGIDSLLPSGRIVWIKAVNPQITRAEEELQNDWLAVDRSAKRTGKKLEFLHDYNKAVDLAKKNGVNCLLDFETTWCGPCKTMDQLVYTADTVVVAAKNIVSVKIDGDEHRDLVKKYSVTGYPSLILISPDGKVLKRASGYQSVSDVVKFLQSQ